MYFVRTSLLAILTLTLGCAERQPPRSLSVDAGVSASEEALAQVVLGGRRALARGCIGCHDDGDGTLAGRRSPMPGSQSFPTNLTADAETGLGGWSDDAIAGAIRDGVDDQEATLCPSMPRYPEMEDAELRAITAWLRELPAVRREVPASSCEAPELDASTPVDGGCADHGSVVAEAGVEAGTAGGSDAGAGDAATSIRADLLVAAAATDLATADLLAPPTSRVDLGATSVPDLGTVAVGASCVVRINELATAGAGGPLDEFVELYNPCTRTIDLEDSRLVYRSSSGDTDDTLLRFGVVTLPPGGFLVCGGARYGGHADFAFHGGLSSVGGGLALRDAKGRLGDHLGWGDATNDYVRGDAAFAPTAAEAIGRFPDGEDSGDNRSDLHARAATPGRPNR